MLNSVFKGARNRLQGSALCIPYKDAYYLSCNCGRFCPSMTFAHVIICGAAEPKKGGFELQRLPPPLQCMLHECTILSQSDTASSTGKFTRRHSARNPELETAYKMENHSCGTVQKNLSLFNFFSCPHEYHY